MRTDHSLLISGRGSPLSSSLTDAETGESDISDSFTFWIEAVSSYTDLNIFFIGIFFMEVCINNCLIIGFILFSIPCIYREIRIPWDSTFLWIFNFIQSGYFIHGFFIQIYISCMSNKCSDKPISGYQGSKWVIITEDSVRNDCFPYSAFYIFPVFDSFTSCNVRLSFYCRTVGDTLVCRSSVNRINSFTV